MLVVDRTNYRRQEPFTCVEEINSKFFTPNFKFVGYLYKAATRINTEMFTGST